MEVRQVDQVGVFRADKMAKTNLFETPRFFCDVYCLAPGQAQAPHAHADVISLDAKPALAIAGVLGVFSGRDLVADGVGPIPTLIAERGGGIKSRDGSPFAESTWHPLAIDRVRHVGEPVAIVIGASAAAADQLCG